LSALNIILIIVAIALIVVGIIFVIGGTAPENTNPGETICTGAVMVLVGLGVGILVRFRHKKEKEVKIVQQIDLTGDLNLEKLKCQQCGAPLDKNAIEVKAGAITVHCPYCGANYQISEEPKW
jgi:hypothetical protein